MFDVGPLPVALVVSIVGSTLLVWHRHGGPKWMFVLGGFFFILGRLMIAAICAYLVQSLAPMVDDMDGERLPVFGLMVAAFLAIGAWSAFVVARAIYRDAFGMAEEEAARARRSGQAAM